MALLFAIMASFFASKVIRKSYFAVNKKYLMATAILILFSLPILGHVQYQGRDNVVVEYIGGKYEARIRVVHFPNGEEFYYIKGGEGFSGYYDAKFRVSLDWINESTPEDSVFLSWWDYGHMIRGIAEREVVIFAPSEEILWTIPDPSSIEEYSDHQRILDVAYALCTTTSTETISMMNKYNATYIFVSEDDIAKAGVLLKIIGKNPATYITQEVFTEEGKKMTLYKILRMMSVDGLEMSYSDMNVTIYRLKD